MKYILDTHTVLWLATSSSALSETAKRTILDPENDFFVSIASAWEVAIKVGTGKLRLVDGVSKFFSIVHENGFELLPITKEHVKTLETLPPLHRDPFDRILIASAMTEGMYLITADTNIHRYDVAKLW